ncbi:hypothetical protein AAFF_G00135790 [Aldrovandia affinis]|uniref:Uncharacterized protein n=1 Tax=Aldrovandia affinis TaxID=143900 RepID=A0AAD7RPU3_9TELE|nr:hypothetical protein AAFF_G00135790 [Aldrovandia affinis]
MAGAHLHPRDSVTERFPSSGGQSKGKPLLCRAGGHGEQSCARLAVGPTSTECTQGTQRQSHAMDGRTDGCVHF